MSPGIKGEARRLVESLPDDSSWEDLMYKIYVRKTIESGLADSDAGRVTDVEKEGKIWIAQQTAFRKAFGETPP